MRYIGSAGCGPRTEIMDRFQIPTEVHDVLPGNYGECLCSIACEENFASFPRIEGGEQWGLKGTPCVFP